jgi:exocyst complex protein 7
VAAENVAKALTATQETLREFDVPRGLEARLAAPVGADVDGYLADVEKLLDAAAFFEEHADMLAAAEPALRGAKELLSRAMARCDEKLRAHLAAHARDDAAACPPGKEPDAGGELPPPLPDDALPVLQKLIEQMEAVGYDEYETALVEVRALTLDGALARQGLDKLSAGEVARLPPEALGERALLWGRVLRWACALWASERPLLDALLPPDAAADAAASIAAHSLDALCAFGEAAVAARHGAERLFAFVDLHTAASAAARPLSKALAGAAGKRPLSRLAALGAAAGDAAAEAFEDFEASVGRDDKRPAGPDGTVHPLTASCMHALRRLFELPQLFDMLAGTGETPPPPPPPGRRAKKGDAPPPLPASETALEEVGSAALRIIMALHTALEARARACKAAGLGDLFLLNNIHFLARTVRASPLLLDTLGDDWLARQEALVDAHATAVLAATWGAAAAEVSDTRGLDPNALSTKDRERVKDKFRVFNEALDALSSTLPHWSVPDGELRAHLRARLHDAVLPAYEALYDEFAGRHAHAHALRPSCGPGTSAHAVSPRPPRLPARARSSFTKFKEKYVKYAPDEAERVFQSFFEGLRD